MSDESLPSLFLESAILRFRSLRALGEQAMAQLEEADFHWTPDPESNSIAVLVQHLHGNMMSRWTDFLTSDGEKPWRERDQEFVSGAAAPRALILERWEEGWRCLERALSELRPEDLTRKVVIRDERLSVVDAVHRQMLHYGNHVGQIVYLAKHRRGGSWKTLSIPRGASRSFRPAGRA